MKNIPYTVDELLCVIKHFVDTHGTDSQLHLGSLAPDNRDVHIGYIDGSMTVTVLPHNTPVIGRDDE